MLLSSLWLVVLIWVSLYALNIYISNTQSGNVVILLAAIAISFALWVIPAFQGNDWRTSNLRKRGFEFLNVVQAGSKQEALAIAMNSSVKTNEEKSTVQLGYGNDLYFASNPIGIPSGAIFGFILLILGLVVSLISTKPDNKDFLGFLFSENRIQSEIAAQVDPNNPIAAIAFAGDILDFIASGNLNNLKPAVRKKDYFLFVLYSIKTDMKSYKGKFDKFKSFSKVDASKALGFNGTYIGFWGNFYLLGDHLLSDGVTVNLIESEESNIAISEETPGEESSDRKEMNEEHANNTYYIPEPKPDVIITYDQAVSIIEALPEIRETSKRIIEVSEGKVHPRFYPKHEEYEYEIYKGKKYNAINFIEDHEDHIVALNEFLISLDGVDIFRWDLETNDYIKLEM